MCNFEKMLFSNVGFLGDKNIYDGNGYIILYIFSFNLWFKYDDFFNVLGVNVCVEMQSERLLKFWTNFFVQNSNEKNKKQDLRKWETVDRWENKRRRER